MTDRRQLEQERLDALDQVWEALGTSHHDVLSYVWADAQIDAGALSELGEKVVPILSATWNYTPWPDDERIDAYDLGDGFYYLVYRDMADESILLGVTLKRYPESAFTRAQVEWFDKWFDQADVPTSLHAREIGQVWFRRKLVERVLNGADLGRAVREADEPDLALIRTVWKATVVQEPASTRRHDPPGLDHIDDEDQGDDDDLLLAWLDTVVIRWRDSKEELTTDEARALRSVCQYLVTAREEARLD